MLALCRLKSSGILRRANWQIRSLQLFRRIVVSAYLGFSNPRREADVTGAALAVLTSRHDITSQKT
jgi:hypothetical protein